MSGILTTEELQGVWSRDWIEANGQRSNESKVFWAQAGDLFVDIRIPHQRPDVSSISCLADLSQEQLDQLLKAEGFAGHIDLTDSVCTWHREINWHGPPTDIDAGALHIDSNAGLIETGVHASYTEQWQHFAKTPFKAHRVTAADVHGIVLLSDNYFFLGAGIPVAQQHQSGCAEKTEASAARHFTSEYIFGHWNGTSGIADLHTNPLSEKTEVIRSEAGDLFWYRQDYYGVAVKTRLNCIPV